jgi:hypothetical protein
MLCAEDGVASPEARLDLAALWATEYPKFARSRQRIASCGQWRRNEIEPHVPPDWADNPDAFKVVLPHAALLSLHTASFLGRRAPAYRRQHDETQQGLQTSSKVELWLEGTDHELKSDGEDQWDAEIAFSCHDAEWGGLVLPAPAHYDRVLSFTDTDGQISARFQRNRDGLSPSEYAASGGKSYRAHAGRSSQAYARYAADAQARALPLALRLLPPSMCLPFGVDGKTGKVDALLVRSQRTIVSLRRQGIAFEPVQGPAVPAPDQTSGGSSLSGTGLTYDLYELFLSSPCRVIMQVGSGATGYRTTYRELDHAEIDLSAEYGLSELPGGYFYGAHWPNDPDPDQKGIPFLFAFLGLLRGLNEMISAQVAHTYNIGFGGWLSSLAGLAGEQLEVFLEQGKPRELQVKPGRITLVPGPTIPAAHPGSTGDASDFVRTALELLERLSPTAAILQSTEASGFAGGVAQSAADNMHQMIISGAQRCHERLAEAKLELASCLSAYVFKKPIPVYAHTSREGTKQDHVELSAEDLDGDFQITTYFPTKQGSNLALAQAGANWVRGDEQNPPLISRREWRESFYGDEQPEQALREIWLEQELESEQSRAEIRRLRDQYREDAMRIKREQLQERGLASPGGLPAAALPARPGGVPPPGAPPTGADQLAGGLPQPNTGNPAQSALGGIMAGATQTQPQAAVIRATGSPVEVGS